MARASPSTRENGHCFHDSHLEQVGVDAVFAGGKDIHLRPLLAAIAEEGLAILKAVVAGDAAREDLTRLQGYTVNGLDEADLLVSDHNHRLSRHFVKKRRQYVKPGLQ